MSSNFKPPKLRNLNSKETATTFESWKGNLIYNLTLDPNFEEFIDCTWTKKTQDSLRGFTDIKTEAGAIVKTAAQRARFLDLCLNHIAGYTPISRFTIVRDSTSLKEIFHKIRAHYCTISSIREEISASIPELLQELNEKESPPSIFQSNAFGSRPPARFQQPRSQGYRPNGRPQGQYQGARPRYPNPPQRSNYQPRGFSPHLVHYANRPADLNSITI